MIDDEAKVQIDSVARGNRPLIISDIDEVILNFVIPFQAFLAARGYRLVTDTYQLTGNVFDAETGAAVDAEHVRQMLWRFFDTQAEWQNLVTGALPKLEELSASYDIILLTAMPHAHRDARIDFMRNLGIPWPILTVESDKGHSVAVLAEGRPAVFIDDLAHNHHSVAEHAPHVHLFQFMAFRDYSGGFPTPPEQTAYFLDWDTMAEAVKSRLG
jgi:hypothetical protein